MSADKNIEKRKMLTRALVEGLVEANYSGRIWINDDASSVRIDAKAFLALMNVDEFHDTPAVIYERTKSKGAPLI